MSNPAFIDLKELSYQYDSRSVLKHVNLKLGEKGFYVLIGPNGGGKTTTLKLLMGILSPLSGSISIGGNPTQTFREEIGYVPQKLHFDPSFPLSVKEFVLSGAISKLPWYGVWPKSIQSKANELLTEVGMIGLANEQVSTLSGGQFQRISIARALIDNPKLLLLDEPFSGLDPDTTRYIFSLLKKMKGEKTIILVTHTLSKILEVADEIYSVNHSITKMDPKNVCEHFSYGIYHEEKEEHP